MSYCLNPACQYPENLGDRNSCSSCGKNLLPLRDRCYIIRPLGGGRFGQTFLAEDQDKLNELCVIKQSVPPLQGTSAQNKATQLFEQEAKRLQQLGEHPQISALYACFKQDDYLYLVRQLVVGICANSWTCKELLTSSKSGNYWLIYYLYCSLFMIAK